MRKTPLTLVALALAAALPVTAAHATAATGDTMMATEPAEREDNDFPWGLLGLLGLAGLLGRKRSDHNHNDRTRV